jgi:restriction endonuclease Mrr
VLSQQPAAIDNAFLGQFEEFVAFKHKSNKNDADLEHMVRSTPEKEVTPDERMEEAYRELREALADDLLTRVRKLRLLGRTRERDHVADVLHARANIIRRSKPRPKPAWGTVP